MIEALKALFSTTARKLIALILASIVSATAIVQTGLVDWVDGQTDETTEVSE